MVNGLTRAFDLLLDLQRSMDRARTGGWSGYGTAGGGAFPSVNVFSEDDGVVVVAELPGVAKGDVDVQVRRDQVRISGTKTIDYGSDVSLHRRERRAGAFDRTFTLPFQIDAGAVEAHHRQGLLAVRLPRAAADRSHSITVE
jgi:HSP20 family protein